MVRATEEAGTASRNSAQFRGSVRSNGSGDGLGLTSSMENNAPDDDGERKSPTMNRTRTDHELAFLTASRPVKRPSVHSKDGSMNKESTLALNRIESEGSNRSRSNSEYSGSAFQQPQGLSRAPAISHGNTMRHGQTMGHTGTIAPPDALDMVLSMTRTAPRDCAVSNGFGDTCLAIGTLEGGYGTQSHWGLRTGTDWSLPCSPSRTGRTPMTLGEQNWLDQDFSTHCQITVAEERDDMVEAVLSQPAVHPLVRAASTSMITVTRPRLRAFLAGDGAVYSQYDLQRPRYVGGPLLEGWEACTSRTTGRMYYRNQETGETQWEFPELPLSPDWVQKKSRSTGASYYTNRDTGQTTWTRPRDDDKYIKLMLKKEIAANERKGSANGKLAIEGDKDSSLAALPAPASRRSSGASNVRAQLLDFTVTAPSSSSRKNSDANITTQRIELPSPASPQSRRHGDTANLSLSKHQPEIPGSSPQSRQPSKASQCPSRLLQDALGESTPAARLAASSNSLAPPATDSDRLASKESVLTQRMAPAPIKT